MVAPPVLHIDSMAITGGMGGVGKQCAQALAPLTTRLLLAGRRAGGAQPAPWATSVTAMQLDVGMAADMQGLHAAAPHVVLHASGTLADGVVRNQHAASVRRVWASKAAKACLQGMHGLVMQLPACCSVIFSSVAVPIASAGQVR